ncbi:MAG: hypothetical protein CL908_13725 [Deltaproteobacteria bacterium]|jgi:hypothetical protein|nr:hypothetical protein [Deltaproteobacteria bacterium]
MNADTLSSIRPRRPVALIDLVETETPDATRAFARRVAQIAEAAGGRVMLANEALAPMVVPDESAPRSDLAIRLLVVTQYPTRQAGQIALDERKNSGPEFSSEAVRTYAARPVEGIESWIGRSLPYTLGLLRRQPVPRIDDPQELEALIRSALILGEQPDEARWIELAERSANRPIWMLNFLEFAKAAAYADDAQGPAPAPISGARAYRRYGSGMISSLAAVGGRVGWSGYTIGQLAGRDDGRWHQVAIAVYPSAAAMMTMLALPKYRAAHVHRAAALTRTRLLATQPIEGLA